MREEVQVGGQAVIEGVLIKSPKKLAIAVRKPNNRIIVRKEKINPISNRIRFLGWPFIRGVVVLVDSLVTGIKALNYSANIALEEEDEKISNWAIALTIFLALLIAIVVFVVIPFFVTKLLFKADNLLFNIIDGVLRLLVLFVYILLISRIKDIQRIFQYHGAEHMAVNCYEAGEKLTVKNAKKYATLHPRCGTAFLLIVVFVSILVFSIVTSHSIYIKLLSRILLLPVVAGISYELLKLGSKHHKNPFFKVLIAPGLFLQKLTTRKPDKKQLEIALRALNAVLNA